MYLESKRSVFPSYCHLTYYVEKKVNVHCLTRTQNAKQSQRGDLSWFFIWTYMKYPSEMCNMIK